MELKHSFKDFQIHSIKIFYEHMNDQDYSDVTLTTIDDTQMRANKIILSTACIFFRTIFQRYSNFS